MTGPIILAIDTATPCGGVALWRQGRLLAAVSLVTLREHSQQLFRGISDVLTASDVQRNEIGAVGVTSGPGSFTGLRIGLSAAKGLCRALGVPLIPVSTLAALAARLPCVTRPVGCLLDARRAEVYAGLYDTSGGSPVCLEQPRVTSLQELLVQWGGKDVLFTGDGVDAFHEKLPPTASVAPPSIRRPDAATVAWLAEAYLLRGQKADIVGVEPEYLRTPVYPTTQEQAAARGL